MLIVVFGCDATVVVVVVVVVGVGVGVVGSCCCFHKTSRYEILSST